MAYYEDRIRVRVCGICLQADQLLLVRHSGIGEGGVFWAPPGGGLELGEKVQDCLTREMLEETGLEVSLEAFLFTMEFVQLPLHAIELFFQVKPTGGQLRRGFDPEPASVRIEEVAWMNLAQIGSISAGQKHQCLHSLSSWNSLCYPRHTFRFSQ
jgi:8-oxo-dGTP diphosphatase